MNKWLKKALLCLCCFCTTFAVGLTAACTDEEVSSVTSETESSVSESEVEESEVEDSEEDGATSSSSEEEEEPCEHVWDTVGEVVAPATCMEDGVKQYLCTLCGDGKTETIAAIGHDYAVRTVAPTCANQGYDLHICGNCEDEYRDNYVETIAHSYGTQPVAATCTAQGYTLYSCEVCKDTYKDNYVAALGHTFSQTESGAATCTIKGFTTYECGCGERYVVETPALGHNTVGCVWQKQENLVHVSGCEYNEVSTTVCNACRNVVNKYQTVYKHAYNAKIERAATCMESGVKAYTCGGCGDSYTEEYSDASAHTFVAQASTYGTSGVVTYACECGETKTAYSAKGNEGATVPNDAVQSGAEIELKNATMSLSDELRNQLQGADVSLSATTQSAPANMSQADKDRLGSNPVYNFTMEQTGSAVTNFDGMMTITVPYTLGENEDPDEIAVWYIDDNGVATPIPAVYSNGTATFQTNHFSCYSVIRLTAEERCAIYTHMLRERVVEATCETDGYTLTYCIRCGHNEMSNEVSALGHAYADTVTDATCTTKGYTTHVCGNCGDRYVDAYVNEFGHNYIATVKPATCTAKGYTVNACERCSDTYTDAYVPVTAHNYTSIIILPTCTDKGYTKYTCTACARSYNGEYTNAIGHAYTDGVCSNCGKSNPLDQVVTDGNYYLQLIENLFNLNTFYFELNDFTYVQTVTRDGELTERTIATVDLARLAFYLDENGYFVGGGEGVIAFERVDEMSEETYAGEIYLLLEDGYAYSYIVMEYSNGHTETIVMDVSQDEWFEQAFGSGDMNSMLASLVSMPEMLDQLGLGAIVDILEGAKTQYSAEINDLLKRTIEFVFEKEAIENGYAYELRFDCLLEIYDVIYGNSLIEVIDIVLGDGTYDKVYNYLLSSLDKTVKEVETELNVILTLCGGDINDVYTLLEMVFVEQGSDVDFATIIAEYYTYTVSQMLDMMTGSEEAQDYRAMLVELNEMLGAMTLGDVIESMGGSGDNNGDSAPDMEARPDYSSSEFPETTEDSEYPGEEDRWEGEVERPIVRPGKQYASVDEIAQGRAMLEQMLAAMQGLEIGFTANKRGELLSVYATIPEMVVGGSSYGEVGGSTTVQEVSIGMSFELRFNEEMPALGEEARRAAQQNRIEFNFEAILQAMNEYEYNDKLGVMVDGKAYVATSPKGYSSYWQNWMESGKFAYEAVGTDTVNGERATKYRLETGFVVSVFDPSNIDYMMQTSCQDVVLYDLLGEGWYPNASFYVWVNAEGIILNEELIVNTDMQLQSGSYTEYTPWGEDRGSSAQISTYYNTLHNQYVYRYVDGVHDYVEIDRVDVSNCGERGYVLYQCTKCGNTYTEMLYISHETEMKYILVEGATSCEDGIVYADVCRLCGKVVYQSSYIEYGHYTFSQAEKVDTSNCGDIYLETWNCACGQYYWQEEAVNSNCRFYYNEIEDNDKGNYTQTAYCLDCGYSFSHSTNVVSNGCFYTVTETYILGTHTGGNNISKTYTITGEAHERVTDYYPDGNGNEVCFEECVVCNKVLTHYATGRDTYGRDTYYADYITQKGYQRVYDANCNYVEYNLIFNGVETSLGEVIDQGTNHIYYEYSKLKPGSVTCEGGVYVMYGCSACGYEEIAYEINWHELYHNSYVVPSDCGGLTVTWYGCACGEEVRDIQYDKSQTCYLDHISSHSFDDEIKMDWYTEEYRCPIKNHGENGPVCGLTLVREGYCVWAGTCRVQYFITYTFYSSSAKTEVLFTLSRHYYRDRHDYQSTTVDLGNGVREITYACAGGCGEGYIERYDRYNRWIYYSNLQRTDGWRKEIDEYCNFVEYHFYLENGRVVEYVSGEGSDAHADSWYNWYVLESSCTQYNLEYHRCIACGLGEYSEYGTPTGHYFNYDYELGCYVCTTCGLQNDSDANGLFIMEDMTGRDGTSTLKAGFYNHYSIHEYDFDFAIVINYADDGVGTEVLYSNRGQDEVHTDLFDYMTYGQTGLITFNMDVLNEAIEAYKAQYGYGVEIEITISFSIYQRSTQTYLDHIMTFDPIA